MNNSKNNIKINSSGNQRTIINSHDSNNIFLKSSFENFELVSNKKSIEKLKKNNLKIDDQIFSKNNSIIENYHDFIKNNGFNDSERLNSSYLDEDFILDKDNYEYIRRNNFKTTTSNTTHCICYR